VDAWQSWLLRPTIICPGDLGSNLGVDKIFSYSVCNENEFKFAGH
jgi:hypothetical protein